MSSQARSLRDLPTDPARVVLAFLSVKEIVQLWGFSKKLANEWKLAEALNTPRDVYASANDVKVHLERLMCPGATRLLRPASTLSDKIRRAKSRAGLPTTPPLLADIEVKFFNEFTNSLRNASPTPPSHTKFSHLQLRWRSDGETAVNFARFPSLTHIEFSQGRGFDMACLQTAENLRSLYVYSNGSKLRCSDPSFSLPRLRTFRVGGEFQDRSVIARVFFGLPALTDVHLNVSDNKRPHEDRFALQALMTGQKVLTRLHIKRMKEPLLWRDALDRYGSLSDCRMAATIVAALHEHAAYRSVTALTLDRPNEADLEHIATVFPAVRRLRFTPRDMFKSAIDVARLAALPLVALDVSFPALRAPDFAPFSKLERLRLSGARILSEASVEQCGASLAQTPLQELVLDLCFFSELEFLTAYFDAASAEAAEAAEANRAAALRSLVVLSKPQWFPALEAYLQDVAAGDRGPTFWLLRCGSSVLLNGNRETLLLDVDIQTWRW